MLVVAFGTYDTARHPRVGIILAGLRAHGCAVVEVNRPVGFSTAERVAMLQNPRRSYRLILRLLYCWVRLAAAGLATVRRSNPDAIIVGYLGHFDVVLARILFPRRRIVLDHLIFAGDTAADRGVGQTSVKRRLLSQLDRLALHCADVIVVDTDEHLAMVPEARRSYAVVVPVGASDEWFRTPGRVDSAQPLRVVFYGLYTPLQGGAVIGEALGLLAGDTDIHTTMIGTGQDLDATRAAAHANGRVTWLPWVDSERLPGLVAGQDICLGIFGTTAKGQRVVPNKVYQGAAAGCAIITSATAPQRRLLGDAASYVPPGDPAALAGALRELAEDRPRLADLRKRAHRLAICSFTAAAVVEPLLVVLRPPTSAGRSERRALGSRLMEVVRPGPDWKENAMTPTTTPKAPLPPLAIRAWLRYDVVSRVIARLNPATVLEIGCGQGAFGARVARDVDYLGVEPDPSSFTVAQHRIEAQGGTVINGTDKAVPPGTTYDVVCAFEVLEHIEDDRAAVSDWVPLIRPGGHLVLSVPAFQSRFGPMDTLAGHFRRYSPDELADRLVGAGLTEVDVTVYAWPLGYALEVVRNRVDAKKLAAEADASIEELTAASGRYLQPATRGIGTLVQAATLPFRYLQRARSTSGTGLVAVARRPV